MIVKSKLLRVEGDRFKIVSLDFEIKDFLKIRPSVVGVGDGEKLTENIMTNLREVRPGDKEADGRSNETYYSVESATKIYIILNGLRVLDIFIMEKNNFALFKVAPSSENPLLIVKNIDKIEGELIMIDFMEYLDGPETKPLVFQNIEFLPVGENLTLFEPVRILTPVSEGKTEAITDEKYENIREKLKKTIGSPLVMCKDWQCQGFTGTGIQVLSQIDSICVLLHTIGETLLDFSLSPLTERVKTKNDGIEFAVGKFLNIFSDWNGK